MEALARFKKFLNESNGSVIDMQWTAYVKSLVNDIRINGVEQYKDFDEDAILEDFQEYLEDKM